MAKIEYEHRNYFKNYDTTVERINNKNINIELKPIRNFNNIDIESINVLLKQYGQFYYERSDHYLNKLSLCLRFKDQLEISDYRNYKKITIKTFIQLINDINNIVGFKLLNNPIINKNYPTYCDRVFDKN